MTVIKVELPEDVARQLAEIAAKVDRLTEIIAPARPYLTAEEVAERLKCSVDTVRRKAREGKLPVARRVGHKMLFDPAAIRA